MPVQLGLDAVLAGTPSDICKTKVRALTPVMVYNALDAAGRRRSQPLERCSILNRIAAR